MSSRTSSKHRRVSNPGDFVVERCENVEKFADRYSGVSRVPKDGLAQKFNNAFANPSFKNESAFLKAWLSEPSEGREKLKSIFKAVAANKNSEAAAEYIIKLFGSIEREELIPDEHLDIYKACIEHESFDNQLSIQTSLFNMRRMGQIPRRNALIKDVEMFTRIADSVPPHSFAALRALDAEEVIKDKGLVYVGYVPELSDLFESKFVSLLHMTDPDLTVEEMGGFLSMYSPFPLVVSKYVDRLISLFGLDACLLMLSYNNYYYPVVSEHIFKHLDIRNKQATYSVMNNYFNAYVNHFVSQYKEISVVHKDKPSVTHNELVTFVETTYSMKNTDALLRLVLENNVKLGVISSDDAAMFFDMPSDIKEQMMSIILGGG